MLPTLSLAGCVSLLLTSTLLAAPSSASYDSYHVGNSHTDSIRNWIKPFSLQGGKSYDIGFQTIPGASLLWNYNNPGGFGTPFTTALTTTNSWEAVVFQIYGDVAGESYAARKLYALALAGNPQTTVFLYNVFPNKDAWTNPPYERTLAAAEQVANELASAYPNAPQPRIVPVGDILIQLGIAATNGQIPGVTSHYDFFASAAGDSHLSSLGQYVGVLTHYACFFREDIRNFPDTVMNGGSVLVSIPPATGTAIRAIMWDYLVSYPRTGINTVLSIRAKSLPVAIAGVPYSTQIISDNGIGAVTWSIVAGSLPGSLQLNSGTGIISGTPGSGVGSHTFTLRARDSQNTAAEREFTLFLESDTAPAITMANLPPAQRGEPYNVAIPVTGGNAPFVWQFVGGQLPPGMEINANGDIFGTPSLEGLYTFEVQVSELIPGYTDTATATLTLQVTAADARTLIPPRSLDAIDPQSGSESIWTETKPIEVGKITTASAQCSATFSLLWDNYDLWVRIEVRDGTPNASGLAVTESDSVDVYIDAFHNREVVYNEDDRRVTITRDGRLFEPSLRTAGIRHGVQATADGYRVVVAIPWSNLAIAPFPGQSLGLDIGVNDNPGTGLLSKRVWWGNADNPTTTLHFGNVLLGSATAGTQLAYPEAPATLTATPTGDSSIRLDWTYTATAAAQQWVLMRAVGNGEFTYLTILQGAAHTYSDTTLAVDTTYHYIIQARNRSADGPWSYGVGCTTATRQPFVESNGLIVMEAENYETLVPRSDPTPYRISSSTSGYSGTGYIDTANNSTQNSTDSAGWNAATEVTYRFIVPTAGSYGVRIRLIALTGGDDSSFAGLNGTQIGGSQFTGPSASWVWSAQLSLGTLEAGVHTFHLRKREDGMLIDRIAIIRSGASAPSGAASGPAESARGPVAGAPLPGLPAQPVSGSGSDPQTEYPLHWASSTGALVYHVERALADGVYLRVASLPRETLGFIDRGLIPGGHYRYRIVAQNLSGEQPGPEFNCQTASPPSISLKVNNNSLQLEIPAQTGYRYIIDKSTNLIDWTILHSITDTSGTVTLADSPVSTIPVYYQLRLSRP
ncbi:MAG: sugar-binding protein [Verrucomicrobiota bacterium]|nr:sugar-binding protein [Verrucomicrobiota bacterium]